MAVVVGNVRMAGDNHDMSFDCIEAAGTENKCYNYHRKEDDETTEAEDRYTKKKTEEDMCKDELLLDHVGTLNWDTAAASNYLKKQVLAAVDSSTSYYYFATCFAFLLY